MYRETVVVSTLLFNVVLSSLLSGDFDIADGVKLVSISDNSLDEEGRSMGDTPLYRVAKFLHNHELHVRLPNLIEKEKLSKIFSESLKAIDESYKKKNVTGRGSKGDGGGSLALLGLMFAKTLGAAGIGGLGLLTMKAVFSTLFLESSTASTGVSGLFGDLGDLIEADKKLLRTVITTVDNLRGQVATLVTNKDTLTKVINLLDTLDKVVAAIASDTPESLEVAKALLAYAKGLVKDLSADPKVAFILETVGPAIEIASKILESLTKK